MRRVEPPSLDSPWRGRHGDLDRLLSDFFRSEMPHPWPEAPRPDEQPTILPLPARKPRPRRSAWRSRLALAAAIALLLAGGWFLSGKFAGLSGPGYFGGHHEATPSGDAPGKRLREDGVPRHRERIILDQSGRTEFRIDFDSP
ncbi:MAG TPA: hypothetical protein VKD72_18900 [Gemmataceae bacterium]|nr:hypothetical protein [Gemmataceae bacterium]